jgi:hypothetical protein
MKHDWALIFELPLTEKEILNLAQEEKKLSISNTMQLGHQSIRCRTCGATVEMLGTECEEE